MVMPSSEQFDLEHAHDLIADLRGQVDRLTEHIETLTLIVDGTITATGGTQAAPTLITTDSWQSLGSPAATGFTSDHGRYRLTSDGDVEFDIALTAGGGGGTAGSYTYANTLPAAYRPAINRTYPLGRENAASPSPDLHIGTGGTVRVDLPGIGAGLNVGANIRMPLD
jgi:hypothetical protein